LKAFLESRLGVVCHSPKGCFREAFKQQLIPYDDAWLEYVDMRNETTHTYNEDLAEELFTTLPEALRHFDDLFKALDTLK
jgi:nucleotidyltransferase substrate binding protein (TIGR01987 family)